MISPFHSDDKPKHIKARCADGYPTNFTYQWIQNGHNDATTKYIKTLSNHLELSCTLVANYLKALELIKINYHNTDIMI